MVNFAQQGRESAITLECGKIIDLYLKIPDLRETYIQVVPKICLMMKLVVLKPKDVTNESSSNQYTKFPIFDTLFFFKQAN